MSVIVLVNGDMVRYLPLHIYIYCLTGIVVDRLVLWRFSFFADFRPDYTKLSFFKQYYPTVPILALTATATKRVQEDVIYQLRLDSCLVFCSSFNRPNLQYEVRPKKKREAAVEEMVTLILDKFTTTMGNKRANWKVKSGIVYCLSKMDCENLAAKLDEQLSVRLDNGSTRKARVK